MIATLDVFDIHSYEPSAVISLVASLCSSCFDPTSLATQMPYGVTTESWNRVMDLVFDVNLASEQLAKQQLFRMSSIGNHLENETK
jgi:hypothetical protein